MIRYSVFTKQRYLCFGSIRCFTCGGRTYSEKSSWGRAPSERWGHAFPFMRVFHAVHKHSIITPVLMRRLCAASVIGTGTALTYPRGAVFYLTVYNQWVSLLRPFARLLLRTFLPLESDILFLKPCSLLLCLFLGWYVLSIFTSDFFISINFLFLQIDSLYYNIQNISLSIRIFNFLSDFYPNRSLILTIGGLYDIINPYVNI